tara:strand:- start:2184 stop:4004 length:1821 start_codon:yes stop_codon:yes gene_type:complete
MAEKIVSPGVFTQENDLSFVPQGVAEIGAAIIGPTVKGPAGIPTKVSNFGEYQTIFGTTFNSGSDTYEYFTSLAAEQYLANSGALTVVRILSGSGVAKASASIASGGAAAGRFNGIPTSESWSALAAETPSQSFQLILRNDGAFGNSDDLTATGQVYGTNGLLSNGTSDNVRWEIANINKGTGTFSLYIRRGNDTDNAKVVLETWNNLSLDPKSNNYIRKVIGDSVYTVGDVGTTDPYLQLSGDYANKSAYVYVSANQKTIDYLDTNGNTSSLTNSIGLYTASLPAAVSGTFIGGNDGAIEAAPKFFDEISDNNVQGYNMSATTAGYKTALYLLKNQDQYDINMILVPGMTQANDSALTTLTKEIAEARGDAFFIVDPEVHGQTSVATAAGRSEELISSYGAMYWPWVKIFASRLGKNVWVPASVVMGGVIAFNDKVAAEWYAPAGLNRGGISSAIQAERGLTHANRDTLYESRINPLATFPGQGVVVWGQKTLQKRATALDRVNVRRLLINLKKFVASTTKYLVFENNTSTTRNRFLSTVNPYMEQVQQNQGLYAFKVIMDESNNTPDVIDRNIMKGEVYIQPAKAAEFIVVDFNIMPTGATFGE